METWNKDDPLERMTNDAGRRESKRAYAAFCNYCEMGSARSLRALLRLYKQSPATSPTTSWASISDWSARFDWSARSERFDEIQQNKTLQAYENRRKQIMESGLALTHERLDKLYNIFDQLEKDLKNPDAVWVPDVKSIGMGEKAERVDIVRFNSALFEQARNTLDDIAREVGGRVRMEKVESSVLNLNVNSDDLAKARKVAQEYEKSLLDNDTQSASESQPKTD